MRSSRWHQGDRVKLMLPMDIRVEPAPGNDRTVAFVRGQMVLTGDLGPVETPWKGTVQPWSVPTCRRRFRHCGG